MIKGKKKLLLQPLLMLILVSDLMAWNVDGLQPFDASPRILGGRALGMGGITVIGNRGVDALWGNPAGLTDADAAAFSLDLSLPVFFFAQSGWQEEWRSNLETICSRPFLTGPIGLAVPISTGSRKLVIGLVYRPFYEWDYRKKERFVLIDSWGETRYLNRLQIHGLYRTVAIQAGFTLFRFCSIGTAMHFPANGKFVRKETYEWENELVMESDRDSDKDEFEIDVPPFLTVGTVLRPFSFASIGIFYKPEQEIRFKDEDGWDKIWTMPATFDVGLAVRPVKRLLLVAECQSKPWNMMKINGMIPENMAGGFAYRIGIELFQIIWWRLGAAVDTLPIVDIDENPVTCAMLTFGAGIQNKAIALDVGCAYRFGAWRTDHPILNHKAQEVMLRATMTVKLNSNPDNQKEVMNKTQSCIDSYCRENDKTWSIMKTRRQDNEKDQCIRNRPVADWNGYDRM